MLQRHRLFLIIIVAFVSVLVQSGCRENTLINSKIIPAKNKIGVLDTSLQCLTHTYYDDSAITSVNIGGIPIYQGVGAITDPFFGVMTASTFFQLTSYSFSAAVYSNQTIDSAVLVLPYSGVTYGDTANQSATQTYQVFYLADTLGYASDYYSYSTKSLNATPLSPATTVNVYHLKDSFGVNTLPQNYAAMRIKLDTTAFFSVLRDAFNQLAGLSSPTSQDFTNAFKGICVKPVGSAAKTSMPYFRLDGSGIYSQAGILVYYHTANASVVNDSVQPYYFSTASCAHFNSIGRSYTGYPVNGLFTSTSANDNIIALQNQPGASIDVVIPGLVSKLPPGMVINKAELQLTLLPGYGSDTFGAPEKLYPLGIANGTYPTGIPAGLSYNILDRYPLTSITPLGILDGYVHSNVVAPGLNTFTIDIPREVMAAIAAKTDVLHLHINGTKDFYGAFHMVAGGGGYPDPLYRPRLHIVYSKLN
jgi:hypothetical protein